MPAPLRDVPQDGIELIKRFEGIPDGDPSTVNLDAYLDPVGIWTIGWGHAITYQGTFLRGPQNRGIARALYPGGITLEQAEMLLRGELVNVARDVLRLVQVPLDDGAFAALVSFAFNCGAANLAASTLLRKLNQGDREGAADQFLRWNKARRNGVAVELPGLTRRRRAERALFLGQDWRAEAGRTRGEALPRTLAPERPDPPDDDERVSPPPASRRPAPAVATASPLPSRKVAAKTAAAKAVVAKKAPAKKKPAAKPVAKKASAGRRGGEAPPAAVRSPSAKPRRSG